MLGFEQWKIDQAWESDGWISRHRSWGAAQAAQPQSPKTLVSVKPVEKPYFICPGEAPTIRLLPPTNGKPYAFTRTHRVHHRPARFMQTYQNWLFAYSLSCK